DRLRRRLEERDTRSSEGRTPIDDPALSLRRGFFILSLNVARIPVLFVIGAIMLPVFDMFHTHSGSIAYAHPLFLPMAWCTPLLFSATLGFGGTLYVVAHRALKGDPEIPPDAFIAVALVIYAGLYCASGYLPVSNEGKLVVLLLGFAGLWWMLDRSWQG